MQCNLNSNLIDFDTEPQITVNKDSISPEQKYCPRRDFAEKAKSRGGTTLVTRAYIKESTYS